MSSGKQESIVHRIEQELNVPSITEKLSDGLSASDFNSLLTQVFSLRADAMGSGDLLKQYAGNKYAKPAACNAAAYRRLEADMLCAAEAAGAQSVILSPAALFGCCSAFGTVSQNKIISAIRNLEILSDSSNMLALYAAAEIKNGAYTDRETPVHICTTHRQIRYQVTIAAGNLPHFGLFTMVSAGKSRSSYAFEIEALLFQLRFYSEYWLDKYGQRLSVSFNRRAGYKDPEGFFTRTVDAVSNELPDIEISINENENDTIYYKGLQATIRTDIDGKSVEVGDIGFTDWTQQLLNNKSQRLLISALALDRQMLLL